MDTLLDSKYLMMMSSRFKNFKKKGNNTWNMSCPYCGDSSKNSRKARGYIYPYKGRLTYHCHNCSVNSDIKKMLEHFDVGLYNEYIREKMSLDNPVKKKTTIDVDFSSSKPTFTKIASQDPLRDQTKVSSLHPASSVRQYLDSRKIPEKFYNELYLCGKFKEWINTLVPGKFDNIVKDEARLIIPFKKDGVLFGLQGRALGESSLRYITIMLDENMPKLYGIDSIDTSKKILVVEGPFDSMFLNNAVASAGGVITTTLPYISKDKSKFVIIYDNERRNIHTIKKIDMAIKAGYAVVIWPDNISHKDINDMVLDGYSSDSIHELISDNTFSGLSAKLKLQEWKRT